MPYLLRPSLWRRPGLSIGFYGIRSILKQQLHQLDPAPPACPAKRCALEQIVSHIGTCACIQERFSKRDALFRGYVVPEIWGQTPNSKLSTRSLSPDHR